LFVPEILEADSGVATVADTEKAADETQSFTLVTEILPEIEPTVTVQLDVPCPAVIDHPDGKDQLFVPEPVAVDV
jgi:hypothetical protein